MGYNFQIGSNKIKLLTEYETGTQRVLLLMESILQIVKQLQHARLSVSKNSELQFIEGGHRGLVNIILNVSIQEEFKQNDMG
jgi:hypothetical protein